MAAKFFAILLAFFVLSVTADIKITHPSSSSYAVINSTYNITWDYSGSVPDEISIKLQDNSSTNKSFSGNFGLGQAKTADKSYTWKLDINTAVGDAYNIVFLNGSDPSGNGTVLATSEPFSIKQEGTPPAKDDSQSPTNAATASGSTPSATNGSKPKNSATSLIGSTTLIFGLVIIAVLNNAGL